MIDEEMRAFLATGCALLVGTCDADGTPRATRGWGLDVVAEEPFTVRVLIDRTEEATLHNVARGGQTAITAADVRTLRSLQLKGPATGVEVADGDDEERAERFCQDFFGAIEETDGMPASLTCRIRPAGFAGAVVVVEQVFDQTPGPAAGAALNPT